LVEQLGRAFGDDGVRQAMHAADEPEKLLGGQPVEEAGVVRHDAHPSLDLEVGAARVEPGDANHSLAGRVQSRDEAKECRLSGAVAPEEPEE
jgi:hypothetical protein